MIRESTWNTTHEQANDAITMTHTFSNNVRCIVSWAHRTLMLAHRNNIVDVFPFDEQSYTVRDHSRVLEKIAAIAKLRRKNTRVQRLKEVRHELFGL